MLGPDLFKVLFAILFVLGCLFVLSTLADDMHMSMARFHDRLDQKSAAIKAYKKVVVDFTNNLEEAKTALKRLDPEFSRTSPLMRQRSNRTGSGRK